MTHLKEPPTGQKNLQKKLEKNSAPINEAGNIYHCIPTPFSENIIANGSYEDIVGLCDIKIITSESHNKKNGVWARILANLLGNFRLIPDILFSSICVARKGHMVLQ